jgi:hypothetical protein
MARRIAAYILETRECVIPNARANKFTAGPAIWPLRYPSGTQKNVDLTDSVEGAYQTLVGEKGIDKDPSGRQSVTQFLLKIVP